MQTIKIDTESKYEADKPRKVQRIVAKATVEPSNGIVFHAHRLHKGENVFEMYVDRVDDLMKLVRTEQHATLLKQAEALAEQLSEQWLEENARKASPEKRAELLATQCPHNKWTALPLLGVKTGLPPITSVSFIDANGNEHASFKDVPKDAYIDAIPTPESLASQSRDQLMQFAALIAKALEGKDEKPSQGNRKQR